MLDLARDTTSTVEWAPHSTGDGSVDHSTHHSLGCSQPGNSSQPANGSQPANSSYPANSSQPASGSHPANSSQPANSVSAAQSSAIAAGVAPLPADADNPETVSDDEETLPRTTTGERFSSGEELIVPEAQVLHFDIENNRVHYYEREDSAEEVQVQRYSPTATVRLFETPAELCTLSSLGTRPSEDLAARANRIAAGDETLSLLEHHALQPPRGRPGALGCPGQYSSTAGTSLAATRRRPGLC